MAKANNKFLDYPTSTRSFRQLRFKIGRNIQILRIEQKLTLQKLSKLTDLPAWLLDEYELGKGEIKLFDMLRIASALHVNIIDLLC